MSAFWEHRIISYLHILLFSVNVLFIEFFIVQSISYTPNWKSSLATLSSLLIFLPLVKPVKSINGLNTDMGEENKFTRWYIVKKKKKNQQGNISAYKHRRIWGVYFWGMGYHSETILRFGMKCERRDHVSKHHCGVIKSYLYFKIFKFLCYTKYCVPLYPSQVTFSSWSLETMYEDMVVLIAYCKGNI